MKKLIMFYFLGIIISSYFYFTLKDNCSKEKENNKEISKVEKKVENFASQNFPKNQEEYFQRNFSEMEIKNNDLEKIEIETRKQILDNKIKINNKENKIFLKKEYTKAEWDYIFNLAESKGYQKREEISRKNLEKVNGYLLDKNVIEDFKKIENELWKYKVKINLLSGFRSVEHQKNIFENKLKNKKGDILNGDLDIDILKILEVSSAPGYSKHHTGKALDFSCGNYYHLNNSFKNTNCFRWLSANNFENANKYNFYPSYPEGVKNQGPNPEPWEFIWKKK